MVQLSAVLDALGSLADSDCSADIEIGASAQQNDMQSAALPVLTVILPFGIDASSGKGADPGGVPHCLKAWERWARG